MKIRASLAVLAFIAFSNVANAQSASGDHDGDGKSDILWRNAETGQNWMYLMNGASISSSAGINTVGDPGWEIVGNGDFNGDLKADILWRNQRTGQNWLYLMNGGSVTTSVVINTVSTQWQVAGNADFNGDGRDDILWRHSGTGQVWMYLMDGATIVSSLNVTTVGDSAWRIVATADFDDDGKSDILWRHAVSGQNWMYLMNGATVTNSVAINNVVDQQWRVVGTPDNNADGKADILWRHIGTGQTWLYLMDGSSIASSVEISTVNPDWVIVANGDYDGDAKSDILWRNSVTGQNWMYLMDGASIASSLGVNTVGNLQWQVIDTNVYRAVAPATPVHTWSGTGFSASATQCTNIEFNSIGDSDIQLNAGGDASGVSLGRDEGWVGSGSYPVALFLQIAEGTRNWSFQSSDPGELNPQGSLEITEYVDSYTGERTYSGTWQTVDGEWECSGAECDGATPPSGLPVQGEFSGVGLNGTPFACNI